MARGNQRDAARAKKEKAEAGKKSGHKLTQNDKDDTAAKMRAKQAAADAKKAEQEAQRLEELKQQKAKAT